MCGFGRPDAVDIDAAVYAEPLGDVNGIAKKKKRGYTLTDEVRKPDTRGGGDRQPTGGLKG